MDESIRIWFELEDGREVEFEVVGTFDLEEGSYVAFHPMDEEDEGEVILMRLDEAEDGEVIFLPIEDDEEYAMAGQVFESLFNGEAEIEPLPEDFGEEEYDDSEEEYCYEDQDGRLFLYGEDGRIVYLDENGEPIEE